MTARSTDTNLTGATTEGFYCLLHRPPGLLLHRGHGRTRRRSTDPTRAPADTSKISHKEVNRNSYRPVLIPNHLISTKKGNTPMLKRLMSKRLGAIAGATAVAAVGVASTLAFAGGANADVKSTSFSMARSAASVNANCLQGATAHVNIVSRGPVETMKIRASHLPINTDFDLFVIQVPNAPFGVSWYQGDLQSDAHGNASGTFVGRFSIETFAVAPGTAPAPNVFDQAPFPEATVNPAFNPVQMYHLGLWFNSPVAAQAAGCAATVTPFNGEHNAGVQALSTQNFPDLAGPLSNIN
jgi:hypothetical protein